MKESTGKDTVERALELVAGFIENPRLQLSGHFSLALAEEVLRLRSENQKLQRQVMDLNKAASAYVASTRHLVAAEHCGLGRLLSDDQATCEAGACGLLKAMDRLLTHAHIG